MFMKRRRSATCRGRNQNKLRPLRSARWKESFPSKIPLTYRWHEKNWVEDADKLDIVVKACQTEYIKLKLLNNNAKAYVNAKRLKWQRQAGSFRYWAEYVHFETIGAIQREMEDLTAKHEEWEFEHSEKLTRAQD